MSLSYINLTEIVEIVQELEHEVWEKTEGVEYFNFEVITNGTTLVISFIGIILWSSEEDDREYYEERDSYEPMEPFLRRRLNEELNKLRVLQF